MSNALQSSNISKHLLENENLPVTVNKYSRTRPENSWPGMTGGSTYWGTSAPLPVLQKRYNPKTTDNHLVEMGTDH